jgi:hypothetical protein
MSFFEFLMLPILLFIWLVIYWNDTAHPPSALPVARNNENEFDPITSLIDDTYDLLDQESIRRDERNFYKELRQLRKELSLEKRILNQRMQEQRVKYTRAVRFRPPKVVGGGGIGTLVRTLDTYDNHKQRVGLAQALIPDELARDRIDKAIIEIDQVLVRVKTASSGSQ